MDRTRRILTALRALDTDTLATVTGLNITPGRLEIDDTNALDEIRYSILDDVRHAVTSAYETGQINLDRPTDRPHAVSDGLRRTPRANDYAVLDNAQNLTVDDVTGGPTLRELTSTVVQFVYDGAVIALINHAERHHSGQDDTAEQAG